MASRESPGKMSSDDDWEDVADNYSVVSLPSDAESEDKPIPSPSVSRSSKSKSPVTNTGPKKQDQHKINQRANANLSTTPTSSPPARTLSSKTLQARNRPSPATPPGFDIGKPLFSASSDSTNTFSATTDGPDAIKTDLVAVTLCSSDGRATDSVTVANTRGSHLQSSYRRDVPPAADPRLDLLGMPIRREQVKPVKQATSQHVPGLTATEELDLATLSIKERQKSSLGSYEKADAAIKRGETIGESFDFDQSSTNPVFINDGLRALDSILKDTCAAADKPSTTQRHGGIHSHCKALTSQVNELLPIVAKYSEFWEKPVPAANDIPLDPSLMLWISSLGRTLTDLQDKIKILDAAEATPVDYERILSYLNLVKALADYQRQMDDFLPIMQLDFNEFQAKHMSFPSPTVTEPGMGPRRNSQAPYRDVDQIPRIRQGLYALKDELQRAITILKNCQKWLTEPATVVVSDVIDAMGYVFDAISRALTNNGSEWIENDLLPSAGSRPLTHAEFSNLDTATIDDLKGRIRQICDVVHIDPSESRLWSADMLREHHVCMLIEQQQIDSLESITSVLKEMMYPSVAKRSEFDDFMKEM